MSTSYHRISIVCLIVIAVSVIACIGWSRVEFRRLLLAVICGRIFFFFFSLLARRRLSEVFERRNVRQTMALNFVQRSGSAAMKYAVASSWVVRQRFCVDRPRTCFAVDWLPFFFFFKSPRNRARGIFTGVARSARGEKGLEKVYARKESPLLDTNNVIGKTADTSVQTYIEVDDKVRFEVFTQVVRIENVKCSRPPIEIFERQPIENVSIKLDMATLFYYRTIESNRFCYASITLVRHRWVDQHFFISWHLSNQIFLSIDV